MALYRRRLRLKRVDYVSDITASSDNHTFHNHWSRHRSDTHSRAHRNPDDDTYFEWYADRRIVHTSSSRCHSENTTERGVRLEKNPPNNLYNSHHHRQPLSVAESSLAHYTSLNPNNYTVNYNETCNLNNSECCLSDTNGYAVNRRNTRWYWCRCCRFRFGLVG